MPGNSRRMRIGLLALLVGLAACRAPGPYPARDNGSPGRLTLSPAVARPELRWSNPCDAPGHYPVLDRAAWLHPLFRSLQEVPGCFPVEDGSGGAYLIDRGWLACRDAHTGELRWSCPVESADAQVLPDDDAVVVYDLAEGLPLLTRGRLLRLASSDGDRASFRDDLPVQDLMLAGGGRVYLLSRFAVHALDSLTGGSLWSREYVPRGAHGMEVLGAAAGPGGLALEVRHADRIPADMIVFEPETGAPRWSKEGRPIAVEEGRVVTLSGDTRGFLARRLEDGEPVCGDALEGWEKGFAWSAGDLLIYLARQRVVEPERVVVGSQGALPWPPATRTRLELLARGMKDGAIRWFVACPEGDPRLRFFISGDRVGMITSLPPPAGRDDERLVVRDLRSGLPLWSADVPWGIVRVHIRKDRALVRSRDGWVYAVEWTRR